MVHVMDDVYPGLDELDDEIWIAEQTELGRALLTKDKRIRRLRQEHEAVERASAKMFCLPKGDMTGPQQAARFYENRHRIIQQCRKDGPYIFAVQKASLERVYPRPS